MGANNLENIMVNEDPAGIFPVKNGTLKIVMEAMQSQDDWEIERGLETLREDIRTRDILKVPRKGK